MRCVRAIAQSPAHCLCSGCHRDVPLCLLEVFLAIEPKSFGHRLRVFLVVGPDETLAASRQRRVEK